MATDIENLNALKAAGITGDLITKELLNVVKKRLNFEQVTLRIEPGSKQGDNLMGEIYRIIFQSIDVNQNEEPTSLILKIAPTNETRRNRTQIRDLFLREIFMYEKVLRFFNEIQLSRGIDPFKNGFNECANCYSVISDELSECVFLEDLKLRRFEVMNLREESLSFEHISILMKALGKFHGISLAMKDQQPDKFNQLKSNLSEQFWSGFDVADFKNDFEFLFGRITTCLQEEKRFDLLEKLKQAEGDDIKETIRRMVSGASAEPYAVICHGDVTINNTMFSKNDQGKTVDVQLFDWQFSRYASPVIELVLYLLCSTTKELRDKHYEEFLKIYHESLSDLLMRLGSNPQKLFPYEALLKQFRTFGVYAAFVGAFLIPMVFSNRDSMPDLEHTDTSPKNIFQIPDELEQAYKKHVTNIIDDMARFGYI